MAKISIIEWISNEDCASYTDILVFAKMASVRGTHIADVPCLAAKPHGRAIVVWKQPRGTKVNLLEVGKELTSRLEKKDAKLTEDRLSPVPSR